MVMPGASLLLLSLPCLNLSSGSVSELLYHVLMLSVCKDASEMDL